MISGFSVTVIAWSRTSGRPSGSRWPHWPIALVDRWSNVRWIAWPHHRTRVVHPPASDFRPPARLLSYIRLGSWLLFSHTI